MWQAGRLHGSLQSPDLFGAKIGGGGLDATGNLPATINAVFFDGRHQPGPAFFGEAIKRLGTLKVGGAGPCRKIARAGETRIATGRAFTNLRRLNHDDPRLRLEFRQAARSGKPHPNFVRGGLKEGFVKSSPYGSMVPEAARKNADAIRARMMAGSFDIFAGELKDNTGKVVIAKGTALKQTDVTLESMNYLVEGVIGKV